MVGVVHAVLLYGEHRGVHVAARAVVVGGVHVDYQGLAGDLLGMDAGGVGEPVVRVDDVEVNGARYHTGHDGVVVDFLQQVVGVSA